MSSSPARPDTWSPEQYQRFRRERQQPFWDLVGLVRGRGQARVVDLGCGDGELTAALHRTLQAERTLGVDASPAMLHRAAGLRVAGLEFQAADLAEWEPGERFQTVFSNAALQWLPEHRRLFAHVAGWMATPGELAVQVPANHDHPSHIVAAAVAREQPFRDALGGYVREHAVLPPEEYGLLLHQLGFGEQHVRLQVYVHELASSQDVVEWTRGTLLTDYEARLPAELYDRFLARYREQLLDAIGVHRPYVYAFKRILIWGRRAAT